MIHANQKIYSQHGVFSVFIHIFRLPLLPRQTLDRCRFCIWNATSASGTAVDLIETTFEGTFELSLPLA
jgi:hypothetical protein